MSNFDLFSDIANRLLSNLAISPNAHWAALPSTNRATNGNLALVMSQALDSFFGVKDA